MSQIRNKKRKNGCSLPLNIYQIISYILTPICYIICFLLTYYYYPLGFTIPFIIIFSIITILCIVFIGFATCINPEFDENNVGSVL